MRCMVYTLSLVEAELNVNESLSTIIWENLGDEKRWVLIRQIKGSKDYYY